MAEPEGVRDLLAGVGLATLRLVRLRPGSQGVSRMSVLVGSQSGLRRVQSSTTLPTLPDGAGAVPLKSVCQSVDRLASRLLPSRILTPGALVLACAQ